MRSHLRLNLALNRSMKSIGPSIQNSCKHTTSLSNDSIKSIIFLFLSMYNSLCAASLDCSSSCIRLNLGHQMLKVDIVRVGAGFPACCNLACAASARELVALNRTALANGLPKWILSFSSQNELIQSAKFNYTESLQTIKSVSLMRACVCIKKLGLGCVLQ